MSDAITYTIEETGNKMFDVKVVATTKPQETSEEALKKRSEDILKKFMSKYYALTKCATSAEELIKPFSAEQKMLAEYYKVLYEMRKTGLHFKGFDKVVAIFGRIGLKNTEHIVAVKITPPIIPAKSEQKQDYILLSPVSFLVASWLHLPASVNHILEFEWKNSARMRG